MIGKIIYQDFWHTIIENMEFKEQRAVYNTEGEYLCHRETGNILKSITDFSYKYIPLKTIPELLF